MSRIPLSGRSEMRRRTTIGPGSHCAVHPWNYVVLGGVPTITLAVPGGTCMNDGISPDQFHAFEGVEDWRVIGDGACAYFRTDSLATGARLVQAISEHRHDARPRQLTVDGWCQDVRERSTLIVVNWRSRGHHTRVGWNSPRN